MDNFNVEQNSMSNGTAQSSDNNDSTNNNMEVIFVGQSSSGSNNNYVPINAHTIVDNEFNSCKTLQRKLELKVERAKRNFSQHSSGGGSGTIERKQLEKTNCMIPINRLSIPRYQENVPLVEYKSEISSDDDEVSSPFFPSKSKQSIKLDLSDTFSLQEMTINSDMDDDSDDSQNLELLPPSVRKQYVNKFINYMCCFNAKI